MSVNPAFAAVDLGAESGRVVVGVLERGRVHMEEISRFPNQPVELPDGLHWDIIGLYRHASRGIGLAGRRYPLRSVGVDTWGVDYGLLDEQRRLLGLPYHYRDRRSEGMREQAQTLLPEHHAYQITGIRPMPINTCYQLLSEKESAAFQAASRLALIPDLLTYWLCGVLAHEMTVASTTGLLDAVTGSWARPVINSLGLKEHLFGEVVEPGTVLGRLLSGGQEMPSWPPDAKVVATAGHDTAAAFAAVPAESSQVAVLSSGTWSLLGTELDAPVLTEAARLVGLSNERGILGTVRLLRNIMGLWLLQRCRQDWRQKGEALNYEELACLAGSEKDFALFDPDDGSLMNPNDMPAQIERLIEESGQRVPENKGGLVRSIFLSLSCKYRHVIEALERVTGRRLPIIHIVGGGSRNKFLCQLTADITKREVVAGPAEASSLGNILVQAYALGYLTGREEMRAVARASAGCDCYTPILPTAAADSLYEQFLQVTRPSLS